MKPAEQHHARLARPASPVAILAALALAVLALMSVRPVLAAGLAPIEVGDQERIDISMLGQLFEGRGESFQLETAAGTDGVAGRMSVRSGVVGGNPNWFVFALTNPSDRPVERWLTAERYSLIGSGVIWPDLDARRIEAVTPSVGFLPDRIKSERADIFRITLEPGQTITYAVELTPNRFARLNLWKPLDYELKARDRQLFNGTMLGITGVLGVFLTAVFAANHKAIFPSAALVAWCVLGYLTVDFGFFHKLFNLRAEDNAVYRAATEAAVAASFVIFMHTFLRVGSWHGFIRMLSAVWIVAQLALVGLAVIDPRLAATFARVSFVVVGTLGGLLTLFLALRGQDRALSLVPTWILFLVWIFGVGVTLNGRLSGELVVSGLVAGIVLLVVLIGFTVTQFAFRSQEAGYSGQTGDGHASALAIDGAGAGVFEWNSRRDEVKVGPAIEALLGLSPGELSRKTDEFVRFMHPADRERFKLTLGGVADKGSGTIRVDFRLRHADNSYRWFDLDAASVSTNEQRAVRCVGLVRDVTDAKRAQERLMHDAVHDSLTKLPNRQLFLDRLANTMKRARTDGGPRPTVMFVDIDRFKNVNTSFGLVVGDSLLLTVARRIDKHITRDDTLARVGGDQFAILLTGEQEPRELGLLAERIRRSLRAPIKIVGQDVVLTGSVGITVDDGQAADSQELLREAETAMYRAKREGSDRIELFRPEMRGQGNDRIELESELRQALDRKQIKVYYQPIAYLPTEELVGFEALVRWDHPKKGRVNPAEFISIAEQSDLIGEIGRFVLQRALADLEIWKKELPRSDRPLFVSVNVSRRQIFRSELVQDLRHTLNGAAIVPGTVRLEVTESIAMENPEQATEAMSWLKATGVDLAIDDFGSGYSSLAYLQRFPVDTLKIDRALVQECSVDSAGSVIVRSVVALAHELGKKVIAEGVEDAEDVAFLRSLGCEFGQGFYFGEAMSDREVVALLRGLRKTESRLRRRGFFRLKPAQEAKGSQRKTERRAAAAAAAAAAAEEAASDAVLADSPARLPAPPPVDSAPAKGPAGRPKGLSQLPASTIRSRRPPPTPPPPPAPGPRAAQPYEPAPPNGHRGGEPGRPAAPPPMPAARLSDPPTRPIAPASDLAAALARADGRAGDPGGRGQDPRAELARSEPYIPPLGPAETGRAGSPGPGQPPLGGLVPPLQPHVVDPLQPPTISLSSLPPLALPPLPAAQAADPSTAARKAHLPPAIARSLARLAGGDGSK